VDCIGARYDPAPLQRQPGDTYALAMVIILIDAWVFRLLGEVGAPFVS
jgi:hypothetical protein